MGSLLDFANAICNEFKTNSTVTNANFITKYPGCIKSSPLTKTVVAVGFSSAEITDLGVGLKDERQGIIKLEILVCVPLSKDAINCYDVMQKLIEYLAFTSSYRVGKCEISKVSVNRETSSYQLVSTVEIKTRFTKAVS